MRMPRIHDTTSAQNFPITLRVMSSRCVINATLSADFDAQKSIISFAQSGIAKTRFFPGAINA